MTPSRILAATLILILFSGHSAVGQQIVQSRGQDSRVDYAALINFGPWDDRNYQLSLDDLRLLAPNEGEQRDPIPAFFRVEMRRAWPALRREGPGQYPRSALQIYRQRYGGYLIDGAVYPNVERREGRFVVLMKDGTPEEEWAAHKFLAGEVRVTSPVGAAESAIKIHPVDTDLVIAGSNGPGSGQRMHYSTDGGESWTESTLPLGGTCCDPTVDWSYDGTFAHAATLGNCSFAGCAIWYYRSSDGGATWTDLESVTPGDPRRELTVSNSDKEFLHVDKHPSSPFRNHVYLTWHDGNVMQFARSIDQGHSWSKMSFSSDPRGIGSDIATDKNGHLYYLWPAFSTRQIVLKVSTDGGFSFPPDVSVVASTQASFAFPLPAMETREAFVYVAADADLSDGAFGGSLYVAWTDSTAQTGTDPAGNHGRIQVAYLRNGGSSWTVVTPHETADEDTVDRFHPWLAVGPDGRVHVIFYDTRRDPSRSSVDLFYSFSADGAVTFSTPVRLTSELSPNISDGFELGDYNGLDVVMNDLIAIYTDNRSEGGGGGDSVDVYAIGREATPAIFSDGFESGNLSAWSSAAP